ncbi:MAG TPA: ADP-glyceromanno-heptose 6-epimerase [Planctomycetes bacterium]|nr:ADP-glyceromanno-heptose 6-epimerase [Planctomycetota bacterium]
MIIVTGGAGFIGSNLVHGLNERGCDDILVVGDLEDGTKHLGLNGLRFRDFVDHRDLDALLARLEGETVEAVFHQGACSDTMEHDGRFMMRVNYEASKRWLEFAIGRCPFLYASTAALYGDGSRGFREEPACEYPLNVYGFSKLLFDRHVRRVLDTSPTQIVGLRYFNVYGPQENHKGRMASVIFKFHNAIQAGGDLELFEGSEEFLRDFVFVDDVVDLNLWFLDHPTRSGIFNCGTGRARSFAELADEVVKHYDGASVRRVPFPEELRGRYQAYTQADLTRLRQAGYEREFHSLEDGVASYVKTLQTAGGYHLPREWDS